MNARTKVVIALTAFSLGLYVYLNQGVVDPGTDSTSKKAISTGNQDLVRSWSENYALDKNAVEADGPDDSSVSRKSTVESSRKGAPANLPSPARQSVSSIKDKHIKSLQASRQIAEKTYRAADGHVVKASFVQGEPMLGSDKFIIREHQPLEAGKPSVTYVEIADHLIVKFKKNPTQEDFESFAKDYSLSKAQPLVAANIVRFTIDNPSITRRLELEEALKTNPLVAYVEANYLTYSLAKPNDEFFDGMWGLENEGLSPNGQPQAERYTVDIDIQAATAWDAHTDCSAIPVAVLDTGILPTHPDLEANIVPNSGRDFSNPNNPDTSDFIDRQGHGTHVAGTIGAVGNNSIGTTGVCWKAALIPVKVLNDQGVGSSQSVVNGLLYVSQSGAKVLNMSLGGGPRSAADMDAITRNRIAGILLVIASGNENNDNDVTPAYPASYEDENIISVAATTGLGELAVFSNYGQNSVDIAAPGQAVLSTWSNLADPPELYNVISGTSMASPHVAGAVALFWSYQPELTAAQVKGELLASSLVKTFAPIQVDNQVIQKTIAGNKVMDLSLLLKTAEASVAVDAGITSFQARNSTAATLTITLDEKYAAITKVEVMVGDEVIGSAEGAATSIPIRLPIGAKQADLVVVITDDRGRKFESAAATVELDIEKSVGLEGIKALGLSGTSLCELSQQTDDDATILHSVKVKSARECQKFCDIMGPLVYSSQAEVICSENSQPIYTLKKQ